MSADAPSGAIHDIGYRHYDGPRLGRRHAITTLIADGYRGSFGFGRSARAKIAPLLLVGAACFPALMMVVITIFTRQNELVNDYLEYMEYVQLLVTIFIAVLAPALVARDLRHRVITLYFSRPLERIDYVGAKLAAATLAMFTFMVVPLLVLFLGALLAELSLGSQLPGFLRAVLASFVLSALLASIGVLVATLAPRRGMGVAAVIAVLLLTAAAQGIIGEIANETGHETLATYARLLSPYAIVDGLFASILGAKPTASTLDGTLPIVIFALAAVAVVVLAFLALLWRYRRVSVS